LGQEQAGNPPSGKPLNTTSRTACPADYPGYDGMNTSQAISSAYDQGVKASLIFRSIFATFCADGPQRIFNARDFVSWRG
jgi:hypothetical protein